MQSWPCCKFMLFLLLSGVQHEPSPAVTSQSAQAWLLSVGVYAPTVFFQLRDPLSQHVCQPPPTSQPPHPTSQPAGKFFTFKDVKKKMFKARCGKRNSQREPNHLISSQTFQGEVYLSRSRKCWLQNKFHCLRSCNSANFLWRILRTVHHHLIVCFCKCQFCASLRMRANCGDALSLKSVWRNSAFIPYLPVCKKHPSFRRTPSFSCFLCAKFHWPNGWKHTHLPDAPQPLLFDAQ